MSRIIAYVDGFNLYHGLKEFGHDHGNAHAYLWFDIKSCLETLLSGPELDLIKVKYFTARPYGVGTCARHEMYCSALKQTGVQIIYGKYKQRKVSCPLCSGEFDTFEEKQTDINIALNLVNDTAQDFCDIAVLVSGDTDLVPSLKSVKQLHPSKQCFVVFPPKRNKSYELRSAADKYYDLTKWHCKTFQFPDIINATIQKPQTWY